MVAPMWTFDEKTFEVLDDLASCASECFLELKTFPKEKCTTIFCDVLHLALQWEIPIQSRAVFAEMAMQAVVLVDAQKVLELTRDAATCPMGQDKPFPEDPEILSLGCVEQHEETGTILRKVFEELWNKVQANRWMSHAVTISLLQKWWSLLFPP